MNDVRDRRHDADRGATSGRTGSARQRYDRSAGVDLVVVVVMMVWHDGSGRPSRDRHDRDDARVVGRRRRVDDGAAAAAHVGRERQRLLVLGAPDARADVAGPRRRGRRLNYGRADDDGRQGVGVVEAERYADVDGGRCRLYRLATGVHEDHRAFGWSLVGRNDGRRLNCCCRWKACSSDSL